MGNHYYKVMIVDDELLIRQGILHYINWQEEGFQIIGEASNGKEALAMIASEQPDIIITDIVMPVMNGMAFIQHVKEQYPTIEFIVLSSFADFDYVRATFKSGVVDYILKPKLDAVTLLEALHRVTDSIEKETKTPSNKATIDLKQTLKKLINHYQIDEDIGTLDAQFLDPQFILVEERRHFPNKDQEKGVALSDDATKVILIEDDEQQSLYLINTTPEAIKAISQRAKEMAHVSYLISDAFTSLEQLHTRFQADIQLLRQAYFYLSNQTVLTKDRLPERKVYASMFDLNIFLLLFKQNKLTEATAYLDTHLEQIQADYLYDANELKNFLGNALFNVTIALTALKKETKTLEHKKYQYFNAINHATTFDAAVDHFYRFIGEVRAIVDETKPQPSNNMAQLLNYIDTHYDQSLTLTELADAFHFNPSYLSSYFSNHHNQGFSDYLTSVRINKAKQLLTDSDLSIADIGSMVGYGDHSYFCKVFKKQTDFSPSKYRKVQ